MRKVTKEVVTAFINGHARKVKNTETNGTTLWLHGNAIAWKEGGGTAITLAGWNTVTTRDRINGLLRLLGSDLRVSCVKGKAYLVNVRAGNPVTPLASREIVVL